jgi:hypothetical protein
VIAEDRGEVLADLVAGRLLPSKPIETPSAANRAANASASCAFQASSRRA